MAAKPRVPNIQKPKKNPYNPKKLKPARIVKNAPAKTVKQALANSKRQRQGSLSRWIYDLRHSICSLSSTPMSRRHGHGHAE